MIGWLRKLFRKDSDAYYCRLCGKACRIIDKQADGTFSAVCDRCHYMNVVHGKGVNSVPEGCPRCGQEIELQGDSWYCKSACHHYTVEGNVPVPCGWHGLAKDFGRTWR